MRALRDRLRRAWAVFRWMCLPMPRDPARARRWMNEARMAVGNDPVDFDPGGSP